MRILFLCNKSPWPPKEGGPMAMNQLIEGLSDYGYNIKVLAVNSKKYFIQPDQVPAGYKKKTNIEWVYVNLSVKPFQAFLNFFSSRSYHVERFISKRFEKKLIEVLSKGKYDIIQLETIYMAPYISIIRKYSDAKVILRAHNIEHLIWKRIYNTSKWLPRKIFLKHLYITLKNYEINVIEQFDAVIPISNRDALFYKNHTQKPVKVIPFGLSPEKFKNVVCDKLPENAIYTIGSMNWLPNIEGLKWFLEKCWPILSKKHPDLQFYIAGRHMPQWLAGLKIKNIVIEGEVEDASVFICNKSIAIVPLLSGSGMRIKIIESMGFGKAVVATNIGAEGLDVVNKENIFIADTPNQFVEAISFLYTHPEIVKSVGKKANKYVKKFHNSERIIESLIRFYGEI